MSAMCRTVGLLCCVAAGLALEAGAATPEETAGGGFPEIDAGAIDLTGGAQADTAPKALRVTLAQETSWRSGDNDGVVMNRGSGRIEYSQFFGRDYFVRVDSKLNVFWSNDHRARAEDERVKLETITPEAFLQYSRAGSPTSIKAGVQKLIWGVSEGGAITDEVSPRNFSELFFIPLEESRLGQPMLDADLFSPIGDWSAFYVPTPKFNRLPRRGTAYYVDAFGDAQVRDGERERNEFGLRWKRTFGRSDLSFMAADLVDNDHAFRADGVGADGRLQIAQLDQRFRMAGMTFNYARGDLLLRGEVAYKTPKAFNDAALQILERDVVDSAFGLTWSLGNSNSVGVELVNSHVVDWTRRIAGVPRNSSSVVLNTNLFFLNETLAVNWLTIYSEPYRSVQSSLRSSYEWSDNLSLGLDLHLIDVPDPASTLHRYRGQDQVAFRLQYQF